MRSSLQFRVSTIVLVTGLFMILANVFVLNRFYVYENAASRVMTGDHKTVLAGQLLDSKIHALGAMIDTSVSNGDGNEEFLKKLDEIFAEYRTITGIDLKTSKMSDAISSAKQNPDDLFIQYRNIKTTAFNLYRTAWANKWMTVAKETGIILNDLDNMPYDDASKAAAAIQPKISQMTAIVTGAAIPQASKIMLFSQFGTLKTLLSKYTESVNKSQHVKTARAELVKTLSGEMKKYNDSQSRSMMKLTEGNSHDFLKAFIGFVFCLLCMMVWYWVSMKKFSNQLSKNFSEVVKQMANWVSPSGAAQIEGVTRPAAPDLEMTELYDTLDSVVKRVNQLRKEDVVVKKVLNIPYVLVSRAQQKAVYWNSSFCIIAKAKSLDESGSVSYGNIMKFVDLQSKPVDPVEKCFLENKESSSLVLLKSGNENIATQVTCTPIAGNTGEGQDIEFVMVQIRDLRDENRRLEAELDRQLEAVKVATEEIVKGAAPKPAPNWARKVVTETVANLAKYAQLKSERKKMISEQLEGVWTRVEKEGGLKEALKARLEQLTDEIVAVRNEIHDVNVEANELCQTIMAIGEGGVEILEGYGTIARKTQSFAKDLKHTKTILASCVKEMSKAEELAKSVKSSGNDIDELVKKMSVIHVNNTILEAKTAIGGKELTPQQIMMITENLNEILVQFQRAYRMIDGSVIELDKGFKDLSKRIKNQLSMTTSLLDADFEVYNAIDESGIKVTSNRNEMVELLAKVEKFITHIDTVNNKSTALSERAEKLSEIGKASVELQTHLSKGIRSATDYISNASLSI